MTRATYRTLLGLIVLLSLLLPGLFVYFWDLYHTSDYSLIGLMAKHFLETGEREIFVWRTGYMGILLEVQLIAWMFQIFGMSPITVNLAPALIFLGLIASFFWHLKKTENRTTAVWGTLFLLVSTPYFYGKVIRTQPNYTEIYCFGILLLTGYWLILKNILEKKPSSAWSLIWGCAFLTGFAMYTYGQIYHFLGALLLHGFCIYLWYLRNHKPLLPLLRSFFQPYLVNGSRALRVLVYANGVHFLLASLAWFTDCKSVVIFEKNIRFGALSMVITSIAIHLLFHGLLWRKKIAQILKNTSTGFYLKLIGAGLAFVTGYSPKLIYLYIQKKPAPVQIGGFQPHFENILRNIGFAWNGLLTFLNLTGVPGIYGWIVGLLFFYILYLGLRVFIIRVREAIQQTNLKKLLLISPLGFLFFSACIIFPLTKYIYDETSIRYFLVVLFPLVYFLVLGFQELARQGALFKRITVAIATLLLCHNTWAFYRVIQTSDRGAAWYQIIEELDKNKITEGYGQYWFCYTVNFLTHERIALQPLNSNYIPYYALRVSTRPKIVYIDTPPFLENPDTSPINLTGDLYSLDRKKQLNLPTLRIHQGPLVEKSVQKHGLWFFYLTWLKAV